MSKQMKNKIRQAYIRGIVHCTIWFAMMGCYVYFGMYAIEKYFM